MSYFWAPELREAINTHTYTSTNGNIFYIHYATFCKVCSHSPGPLPATPLSEIISLFPSFRIAFIRSQFAIQITSLFVSPQGKYMRRITYFCIVIKLLCRFHSTSMRTLVLSDNIILLEYL